MKKFLFVLLGLAILVALGSGIGGLVLGGLAYKTAFENQAVSAVNQDVETDLSEVAGYTPDVEAGDQAVPLKSEMQGGNTKLVWETGKIQGGSRYDFDGTWTSLGGAVVYNPKAKALKAIEVVILTESFNSYGSEHPAPGGMINVVIGKGSPPPTGHDPWFNTKDYPQAIFTATEFVAKADDITTDYDNAPEGWTHLIKGEFKLNGKTEKLALPAAIAFDGETVKIDTAFTISRETYAVTPKNPLPGSTVDDIVELTASVKAEPDAGLAIDALTQMISDNSAQIVALNKTNQDLNSQLAVISETLTKLERKIASGATNAQAPAVDISKLPKTMASEVKYPGKDPVPFELVLVPGEGEVGPFYMAKHEVTWEMFYNWAYGSDIDADTYAALQKKNMRPSPLYEDCEQLKLGLGKRPALSMSRTTAEAFAKFVSEQTGKSFRLPTDAEWLTALKLGGGVPASQDELEKQAVIEDNAEEQFDPPFLLLTGEVGSKAPNALGIYDMLGNAAEWVSDTGAERYVRGGHFKMPAGEITADWKAVEEQKIWNETYPQLPLSKFWYRDHYYQGFRLVADVQ